MSSCQQKISNKKEGGFTFNYSTEQRRIYIKNPFENEIIFINEDLYEILGFKNLIIKAENLLAQLYIYLHIICGAITNR